SSEPTRTMHLPSAISGEDEVKNFGRPSVFLRHTSLPVAASRQETVPETPRVQALPSPTAGVLRGPLKLSFLPTAAPFTGVSAFLSCHSSLPLATSRQVSSSSLPLRVKTYTRSPTRTGDATASPTGVLHFFVSALGHSLGATKAVTLLSRLGPRHWGQSWAAATPARSSRQPTATPMRFASFMASPFPHLTHRASPPSVEPRRRQEVVVGKGEGWSEVAHVRPEAVEEGGLAGVGDRVDRQR